MKVCIDQSGKIEQLSKNTVLCISNGEWDTVFIRMRTKRQIQEIFRRHGQTRNFILFTFAAGVSILLKRNKNVMKVIIDEEYFGKGPVIKEIILQMLKGRAKKVEIQFGQIGRKVGAHKRAYLTFTEKIKSKYTICAEEILAEIKKTEVGKRLKDT